MRPVAQTLLVDGIDPRRCEFTDALSCAEPVGLTDVQMSQVCAWSEAHYLAGVAVGLLLRADVVKEGLGELDLEALKGGAK